jgi:hypothetical protein
VVHLISSGTTSGLFLDRCWRIAALGLVAGNIRLRTKAEAGEPLLAPSYEFAACFRKWRSIVFTAGGSRSG